MDKDLIQRKATQIEHSVARINEKLPANLNAFVNDFDAQDIIYRNFQIAVQNAVDIGSHIIATQRLAAPKSMGDVFTQLTTHRLISSKMGKELRDMVTVRNIIVHDYTRIDHKKVFRHLKKAIKTVTQFSLRFI